MGKIMTVLGPILPKELGFTSMHEHVLSDARFYRKRWESLGVIPENFEISRHDKVNLENIGLLKQNYYMLDDNLYVDDEGIIELEVADFKKSGGDALVDLSVPGLRSNLLGVRRISEKTGVHIITSTGLYVEESWPDKFIEMTSSMLTQFMVKEIQEGIEGTEIKAGHIKVAINELSERQEDMLKASAHAANETGVSVTVHPGIGIGSGGRRIARILLDEGMNGQRIILCHTDGSFSNQHSIRDLILRPDAWGLTLDYALDLLDQGVNISIDCFGHFSENDWADVAVETEWHRLAGLVALIKRGFSSQIVLGTDCAFKYHYRRYGGFGYCRLTDYIIPLLREIEVSDYDIRRMTILNPARLLAI